MSSNHSAVWHWHSFTDFSFHWRALLPEVKVWNLQLWYDLYCTRNNQYPGKTAPTLKHQMFCLESPGYILAHFAILQRALSHRDLKNGWNRENNNNNFWTCLQTTLVTGRHLVLVTVEHSSFCTGAHSSLETSSHTSDDSVLHFEISFSALIALLGRVVSRAASGGIGCKA